MTFFNCEVSEVCNVAKCTDQEMARVIWIEIHYYIGALAAMNNEPFFIGQLRDATERALDIVTLEWSILAAQII
jgi:hypothetical protein